MKTQITVRLFQENDAPKCVRILDANKENMGDLYTVESLTESSSYNIYWVAEDNNHIVGMIGFSDLKNGIGMLLSLCVSPTMHGQGIGKVLLQEAKTYAKKHKFRKVLLLTHAKNKPMMILAIKEDFVPEGSLRTHFRTGEDVIYFSYFV